MGSYNRYSFVKSVNSLHKALIIFAGGVCGHCKSWDLPVGRGGSVSSCNRYVLVKSVDRYIKR